MLWNGYKTAASTLKWMAFEHITNDTHEWEMAAGYYFYNFIRRPKVKRNEMERQRNVSAFVRHFAHLFWDMNIRLGSSDICVFVCMWISVKIYSENWKKIPHLFDLVVRIWVCVCTKLAIEISNGILASQTLWKCVCGCVCSYFMLEYFGQN